MSKEELIQLLKDYKENEAKLNIRTKKLKMYKSKLKKLDLETNSTTSYGINQDIHSKNKISNKVLDKIEQNDTERIELKKKIKELEKEVSDLREKVETVKDRLNGLKYKERKILIGYYVDGRSAQDLGNNLYWQLFNQTRSDRHIQRIIDNAIKKMLEL